MDAIEAAMTQPAPMPQTPPDLEETCVDHVQSALCRTDRGCLTVRFGRYLPMVDRSQSPKPGMEATQAVPESLAL